MIHQQRWTAEKITQRLALIEPYVYRRRSEIPPFRFLALDGPIDPKSQSAIHNPPSAIESWPVIDPNTYWGRWQTDFVLRSSFSVPADWSADAPVALYLPLGEAGSFSHPEALIHVDGEPYAASDRHHQEVLLRPEWCDGAEHELALRGWTGLAQSLHGETETQLFMRPCRVVQIDQPTRDFTILARTALGIATRLDENHPAQGILLNGLDAAFKRLDTRAPLAQAFYDSIPAAQAALETAINAAGPALDVNIFAAGHAHIDVAWLWTLDQTRRKTERTFHTVLRLMEQFPDYMFTQSQPQLYDYIKQDQPALFEEIKARVTEGRWEPIGGMWVEADCNISGSESLARQFLLGRTFFREHFGPDAESPILWLPDVFGYAWNLPQLIKEAGLDYFFTIKIGWNQYNRMPYDSFWWQGLDGTRVLTHYSPTPNDGASAHASTYNAMATPASVLGTWTNFQQKEQSRDLLMAFGYGDGGGGPTRQMLENIAAMADFPATPRIRHARAVDMFRALEANSGDVLPVWNGELYLEYHRGTYTSQARNKRANRKSEFLLHNADFLATYATLHVDQSAFPNPQSEINRAWELVCLNQFHDIIPGSSITPVYDDSAVQYEEVRQIGEAISAEALDTLAEAWQADALLVNPNSQPLHEMLFLPGSIEDAPAGSQPISDGALIDVGELAPYSVQPLNAGERRPSPLSVSPQHLENDSLRVELNDAGDITRIYDKAAGREVLPDGGVANQFLAFEDRPKSWDAWDIDIFYDDKQWLAEPAESITVVEEGPLRATLEIKRRMLNSPFVQRISLCHHRPRLDFDTEIEWNERQILLKVAFPVDVLTPAASYEVQWGHVERPIHRNTSWDWARFETAAQKWADVSEGNYGASLLNDCKYGYDIQDTGAGGTIMRLSLLRSPSYPDPVADKGVHRFRYSLLPHAGRVGAETIAHAYALNNPPFAFRRVNVGDAASLVIEPKTPASLVAADHENVVIETVKPAEDGDGVIVRFYESLRQRGPVTLRTGFPIAAAERVNIMEEKQEDLVVEGNAVKLPVHPFQIVTLRLRPQR